ncbi:MAG: copper chaperone PCu(A)C [Caldilinea sp.]|uniref:copper chaperone PCu(A)C n=1 Tax=Caldilinea sp. TaxID=2293560 RepID=UPI0030A5C5BD
MRTYMHRFAVCLLALTFIFAGCTMTPIQPMAPMAGADATATEPPLPEPEPGKLTIVDVRARPAPLAGGTGAVYFTVLNGLDQEVRLVSASSPVANVVETHETVSENGVMKMIPLPDGYAIPAGEALVLKPGGKHIMLIDLVKPLQPGDEFNLTVNFDNGESFELTVPVLDMQMTMPMPDAQHDHGQDHGDAKAEEDSHDHDQGDAEMKEESHSHDQGHMTQSEATMAAIQALPISAVHKLDEALHAGEAMDLNAALETVHELKEKLDAASWPEERKEAVGAIRAKAEALHAALSNNDLNAAKALAAELHDLLHQLEGH